MDEELLLELPLLRLCTDGAAIDAGGAIVRSAARAGKVLKAPNARASSNNTNTASGLNPTIQRDSLDEKKKNLNFRVGV